MKIKNKNKFFSICFTCKKNQMNRMNILIFRVLVIVYTIHTLAECEKSENEAYPTCADFNSSSNHTLIDDCKQRLMFKRAIRTLKKASARSTNESSFKNNQEYKIRRTELKEFYKKLNASIIRHKLVEIELNPAQVIKKIASHLGNGFYLVVFDCNRPSYIDLTDHRVDFTSQQSLKDLKASDKCDRNKNLWYFENPFSLTTWDLRSKKISGRLLPFETLFIIFNKLNMCDDFLKLMRHPAYFYKTTYKRPEQCGVYSTKSDKSSSSSSNYGQNANQASKIYTTTKNQYPSSSQHKKLVTQKSTYYSYTITQRPAPSYPATTYQMSYKPPSSTDSYKPPPGFYPVPAGYYPPGYIPKNC
jgi:hypothetical protein